MRLLIDRKLRLRPLVLLLALPIVSCFSPAQRLELSKTGDCPQTKESQRIFVEGYFSIDPNKGVETESGYEGTHPYSRFSFSAAPNSQSKFEAAVVRANEGSNGPDRANRTEPVKNGDQVLWHLYDNQRREIGLNDRVRITGILI